MQNVATGIEYDGTKEEYMVTINPLIKKYHRPLKSFVKAVVFDTNFPVVESLLEYPVVYERSNAVKILGNFCHSHKEL